MPISPMIRLAIRCGNEPYADAHICEACDDEIADVHVIARGKPDRHLCRRCHDVQAERDRCSNIVASYSSNDQSIGRLLQDILDRIAFPVRP